MSQKLPLQFLFSAAARLRAALPVLVAAGAVAVASLAGCGGGVGEGGTGYAAGPITGFGSVIVNDIVFDDSAARVEDGEGLARGRADLRLGMTVEVESDAIVAGSARATRVRYDSAITGPVEDVDADGFVVLGQHVTVDETTVFDAPLAAGLPAVAPGQVVEVYGLFDAALQRFRATRVELRTNVLVYRVRGIVVELNETLRTLRVGTALFTYGAGVAPPADLAAGRFVRLWLATSPAGANRWSILRFGQAQRDLPDIERVSFKGHVTQLASAASFRIDGREVDASAAVVSGGALVLGARVEVTGRLRAGVIVAATVEVRSDQAERERGFELRGPVESVAADRTSLVLRGITVGLTRPGLRLDNGTLLDLAAGRMVEVRAVLTVGDGTRLDAVELRFRP